MLPELARRIITAYTSPGDLVVDPMCGIGTTPLEAAALGRHCIGVDLEPRWVEVAGANLAFALTPEQRRLADVRVGDAKKLPDVLGDLNGQVDAIVTSPPYLCSVGMIDRDAWLSRRQDMCAPDTFNYSANRDNLGHARGRKYAESMAEVYAACYAALRPGGAIVTVTKNMRRDGALVDLAALTVALLREAGFAYLEHVVALHAAIRDTQLFARPSFWQLSQTRKARSRGLPLHLVVHEDVLVFSKPEATSA